MARGSHRRHPKGRGKDLGIRAHATRVFSRRKRPAWLRRSLESLRLAELEEEAQEALRGSLRAVRKCGRCGRGETSERVVVVLIGGERVCQVCLDPVPPRPPKTSARRPAPALDDLLEAA